MSAVECNDVLVTNDEYLKLYVIGYRFQGESIILTIGNGKFVGVIDCYRTKEEFITKSILEKLNIKRLDFICWTHMDWDHTKGMSQLRKFIKEDTAIILPEGMNAREIDGLINKTEIKNSYKKEFNQIFNMINKVNKNFRLTVNQSSTIFDFNLIFAQSEKKYRFIIDSFAPISGIVNECMSETIQQFYESVTVKERYRELKERWHVDPNRKNNLYSVGLRVIIDSSDARVSICLCGDLDDVTIENMDERKRNKIFNRNTLFKVPHHGSENAYSLFELGCIEEFKYGVTTSFRNKLPTKKMIKAYQKKCRSIARTDLKKGTFGVVTYSIQLKDLIALEPEYENAAGECL